MYFIKTPKLIQNLFPNFTWKIPTNEKVIYLTFDDGPIPEVTPWVLDVLEAYNAKATFFCVGDNVRKHPEVFEQVVKGGHAVGNHTFNHKSGWDTESIEYFHNVRHCAKLVHSNLFRPPYGRVTPKQSLFLARHYQIVMWDVLSGDFDPNITNEVCLSNVINATGRGSIIVFHDSLKAKDKMMYTLPKVIEHFAALGYRFESLDGVVKQRVVAGVENERDLVRA
jgi:peptidoglycan-N-acetylglucosamine deacetylase